MNLLTDHRDYKYEQDESPIVDEMPSEPAAPTFDETTPFEPVAAGHDIPSFEKRRKGSMAPLIVIFVLIVSIAAIAYFGFLRSGDGPADTPIAEQTEPEQTEQEALQPSNITESSEDAQTGQSQPQTQQQPTGQEQRPSQVSAISGESDLARAAIQIRSAFAGLSSNIKLATLIVDENSFSVEVTASSRNTLEAYYTSLKERLSGQLSMAPSPGTGAEARALITGMNKDSDDLASLVSSLSPQDLLSQLSEQARQAGLRVLESTQRSPIRQAGFVRTPVFIKLAGSRSQCEAFISQIATMGLGVRLSKIIYLTQNTDSANLVVLLETVNQ
ncbi:type 4a pilus biogenesis protein PilO [candidate division KSB1 bacterium]|nr:type 4a pilus biogenesis protein PilO [candidate division KSB1 bacterium]